MNFFFKYKTYTSFEPHLLYKQEMLQWMLYFFLIFFLFQWNTEVVNNQQFFFLLILTKKKKGKPASPDDGKKSQLFWSGTEHGRGSDIGFEAHTRSVQTTTFRVVVNL